MTPMTVEYDLSVCFKPDGSVRNVCKAEIECIDSHFTKLHFDLYRAIENPTIKSDW